MLSGLGETQQQLLRVLQRAPQGLGVEALSKQLEVTVTAVRQHLAALGRDGLVTQLPSVPSGGRPAHVYALSRKALETFPRQYTWFSQVLLDALRKQLGSEGLERTLRALGEEAAGAPPERALDFKERVARLVEKMGELGYDASHSSGRDGAEITARNCVFHQLAEQNPEVCAFDLALLARSTGARVSHEECMVRQGRVCRFRLSARPAPASR